MASRSLGTLSAAACGGAVLLFVSLFAMQEPHTNSLQADLSVCPANEKAFIAYQFNAFLHRGPTEKEERQWTTDLDLKREEPAGLIKTLAESNEFTKSDARAILAYKIRGPAFIANAEEYPAQARALWSRAKSLKNIARDMLTAHPQEFKMSDREFINIAYQRLVRRNPYDYEILKWIGAFEKGESATVRSELFADLLGSADAYSAWKADTQVQAIYLTMVGSLPAHEIYTTAITDLERSRGASEWDARMKNIIRDILVSSEYKARSCS